MRASQRQIENPQPGEGFYNKSARSPRRRFVTDRTLGLGVCFVDSKVKLRGGRAYKNSRTVSIEEWKVFAEGSIVVQEAAGSD
jgi:hypothetical protein